MRIANNIAAMNAHRNLSTANAGLSKSLERLSSGYRINRAADDAAGLAISQTFRAEIASLKVASRNTSEANAALQVAEGAVDQISNMLTRLRELATQAASANAGTDRDKINNEATQLMSQIANISTSTEYAGSAMLTGGYGGRVQAGTADDATGVTEVNVDNATLTSGTTFTLSGIGDVITLTNSVNASTQSISIAQATAIGETVKLDFNAFGVTISTNKDVGANWSSMDATTIVLSSAGTATFMVGAENASDNKISVSIGNFQTSALLDGTNALSIDLSTATAAQTAMTDISTAIDYVNTQRGNIGAYQNRLGYAAANIATAVENKQAAESVIRDVDMASEMTTFTKNQILMQAGTAMLGQANMAPQAVLSLLG